MGIVPEGVHELLIRARELGFSTRTKKFFRDWENCEEFKPLSIPVMRDGD